MREIKREGDRERERHTHRDRERRTKSGKVCWKCIEIETETDRCRKGSPFLEL